MLRLLLLMAVTACAAATSSGYSFPMDAALHDDGRVTMELMKQVKANKFAQRNNDVSCPRHFYDSLGPITCENGFAGDFPCRNLDLLSLTNLADLGYDAMPEDNWYTGNDIWGWTDPENDDEYAIIGVSGGTSFVRINDPTNPLPVAFVYTQTVPSIWRDIKTIGSYAFIISEAEDHGMQVYDLTRLRGRQSLVYDLPDATYHRIGRAHNIVANEETNHVYIVGGSKDDAHRNECNGGLHMVDVNDPLNPTFAGCFSKDGYTHDAQCVIYHGPDTEHQGREVCFAYNEDSLTIVDVTDKSSPIMISKRGYTGSSYSHQGWVTEDHTIAFLDDEGDEFGDDGITKTYIWDIQDLDIPVLIDTYRSHLKSVDHNMYVFGDTLYQSNYQSGLRVLHVDQENTSNMLDEIAYFDVYPTSTLPDFAGAWSNYPYYKSKTIAVSSLEYGLFLLKLKDDV